MSPGPWTPLPPSGSGDLRVSRPRCAAIILGFLLAIPTPARAQAARDRGIYPDLDHRLEALLSSSPPVDAAWYSGAGDRDRDGIPDPLDVLRGGLKVTLAAAPYIGGYRRLGFPGGDVPRDEGVCTDVVVRAVRNAGLDLQLEVARDIRRAPRAYPMVKRPDRNIDHRRVKTLLPYFVRNWRAHGAALADPADPLRPGDVIFMDTFAARPGPDHIGLISSRVGPSGLPLVINSWTHGYVTSEMDLLPSVPVTHRFRIP
jgi:uncharacterized protein YijF (DUF1287 family)